LTVAKLKILISMSLINSFKNSITKNLTDKQSRFFRNLIEPPCLYSQSSQNSVLILGCQRSGTTLTYLIFNSHPQIKGIDETETGYSFPHQSILYLNSLKNYVTCLKLPNQTFNFEYINQHFPKTKIIIPVRNPYQVVSSMRSFRIKNKEKQGNWLNCYAKDELIRLGDNFFPEILALNLDKLDEVSLGAYVWKYKNLVIDKYKQAGFDVFAFKYENLLNNPPQVISKILNFVGLDWDNIVLNHQKYYDGDGKRYPGGTRGDRPINTSNKKRQLSLSKNEIESITSICREQMIIYNYSK
jgi:protein-tyrosine sulfotransferase